MGHSCRLGSGPKNSPQTPDKFFSIASEWLPAFAISQVDPLKTVARPMLIQTDTHNVDEY
jgi:hypothetical protein